MRHHWYAWGRAVVLAAALSSTGVSVGACSHEEVIVKTALGTELAAADIDAEPLALVPPGSLALLNLTPKELFQSALGHHLLALAHSQFPLPASAGFEPQRDLERLIVGVYSAAGVDFSGVAVGSFDASAIKAAAEKSEVTPLGTPLVAVRYSQWEFYVSANIGFCVLTPKTVLFGNEVGIRRALDRLERGDLRVQQDPDVEALMRNPGAPIALGASNTDSALDAIVQRTPLANNLRVARVVANLLPPGLNVAGTFTFADPTSAQTSKSGFDQAFAAIQSVEAVGALFGLKPTNLTHQTHVVETSVQVTVATETQVAERLLAGLNELIPQRQPSPHSRRGRPNALPTGILMSVDSRKWPIVAIDGPAGAGKSTVSSRVAQALGYHLLDTGAIYRCVALCALRRGAVEQPDIVGQIAEELAEAQAIRFQEDVSLTRVFIRDEEVTELIRTPEVSTAASVTSSVPAVRRSLLEVQRQFGRTGRVVVEGRDIGSVVFPDAEAKFFLTASTRARAERRFSELSQRGAVVSLATVESDVIERYHRDSTRPIAPLIKAPDAVVVDSTDQSIDQVVQAIVDHVRGVEDTLQANGDG